MSLRQTIGYALLSVPGLMAAVVLDILPMDARLLELALVVVLCLWLGAGLIAR